MNVIPDTNVLVRLIVRDDLQQSRAARNLLKQADSVAISLPAFCEIAWVLRSVYKFTSSEIATPIEALINTDKVVTNRPAVELGLRVLREGGDFADAVIAYEGLWLGGDVFTSFDKKAVKLLAGQGQQTKLLS